MVDGFAHPASVACAAASNPYLGEERLEWETIGKDPCHDSRLFSVKLCERFFEFGCGMFDVASKVVKTVWVEPLMFHTITFVSFFPKHFRFPFCIR